MTPRGIEVSHLVPEGAVDERSGGIEANAPEALAHGPRHLQRGAHRVVLEVDEDDDVDVFRGRLGELRGREHGVPTVGGDERVRDGADAPAAPPGGLRVGGDADRARDVGRVAVAGLHAVVVVPRREEEDRLPAGGLDDAADVRGDERPAREHAEVERLEVREEGVVALDRHHRLPRGDLVAVVERVHGQLVPVVGAELEDGDRLVHPAQHRVLLLEDLHDHPRVPAVLEQRLARVVEVDVGVVALPHLLDREVEDLRREALLLRRERPFAGDSRSEALSQGRVRDLELLGGGLGGDEPLLELVAGPGERAGERMALVGHHPGEDLDGGGDRADAGGDAGDGAQVARAHARRARSRPPWWRAAARSCASRSARARACAGSPCS